MLAPSSLFRHALWPSFCDVSTFVGPIAMPALCLRTGNGENGRREGARGVACCSCCFRLFFIYLFSAPPPRWARRVGDGTAARTCRAHASPRRPRLPQRLDRGSIRSARWTRKRGTQRERASHLSTFFEGRRAKKKGGGVFFFLQKPLRPHARPPLSPSKKKQTNKTLLRTPPSTRSSSASSTPAPAGPAAPSPSPRPRSAPSASPRARS